EAALGGEGVRGAGRGRDQFPVQRLRRRGLAATEWVTSGYHRHGKQPNVWAKRLSLKSPSGRMSDAKRIAAGSRRVHRSTWSRKVLRATRRRHAFRKRWSSGSRAVSNAEFSTRLCG